MANTRPLSLPLRSPPLHRFASTSPPLRLSASPPRRPWPSSRGACLFAHLPSSGFVTLRQVKRVGQRLFPRVTRRSTLLPAPHRPPACPPPSCCLGRLARPSFWPATTQVENRFFSEDDGLRQSGDTAPLRSTPNRFLPSPPRMLRHHPGSLSSNPAMIYQSLAASMAQSHPSPFLGASHITPS